MKLHTYIIYTYIIYKYTIYKYTKYIIDSTQKLNVLISNILKISKIDNQKIVIEQELFELDEQIREVVLSLEKEWTNKNIELDIDLDEVPETEYKETTYELLSDEDFEDDENYI